MGYFRVYKLSSCFLCYSTEPSFKIISFAVEIIFRYCDIATVSDAVFSYRVSTILYALVEHGEFVRFLNRIVVGDLKRLQSESEIRYGEC